MQSDFVYVEKGGGNHPKKSPEFKLRHFGKSEAKPWFYITPFVQNVDLNCRAK